MNDFMGFERLARNRPFSVVIKKKSDLLRHKIGTLPLSNIKRWILSELFIAAEVESDALAFAKDKPALNTVGCFDAEQFKTFSEGRCRRAT